VGRARTAGLTSFLSPPSISVRLATIDVGTNTAQLLVVEAENGALRRVHAAERFVRLGEGIDAHGRIGDEARTPLLEALRAHVSAARSHGADRIVAAGTSALRDAANRQAVLDAVRADAGLEIDLLSGTQEAAWSFAAACAAVDGLTGSCLVVDVGGGSTELVAGHNPEQHAPRYVDAITGRASLDVGCVRLTERCFSSLPPAQDEIERTHTLIDSVLRTADLDAGPDPTLIGTAGTATALALVHNGPASTWDALHGTGFTLSRTDLSHWRERVLRLPVEEIRALHPAAMDGRADVFSVGVLLLDRVMAHYDRDALRVSPYELRHGLALRVLTDR